VAQKIQAVNYDPSKIESLLTSILQSVQENREECNKIREENAKARKEAKEESGRIRLETIQANKDLMKEVKQSLKEVSEAMEKRLAEHVARIGSEFKSLSDKVDVENKLMNDSFNAHKDETHKAISQLQSDMSQFEEQIIGGNSSWKKDISRNLDATTEEIRGEIGKQKLRLDKLEHGREQERMVGIEQVETIAEMFNQQMKLVEENVSSNKREIQSVVFRLESQVKELQTQYQPGQRSREGEGSNDSRDPVGFNGEAPVAATVGRSPQLCMHGVCVR
jgi:hypothetical protein